MSKPTQRRLAAIVSADVVGYSRLMGVDEVGTLEALRAHRAELIDAKIAAHGGRIVKTMGDGLLLEFSSVVDATTCAIEAQQAMASRNADVPDDKRIIFRIGVHVGDIISEGEDILGDGVNIAARVEALAEPGGVAISGRVHDDVRDRLDAGFVDSGEQHLKNIARPVRVWHWSPEARRHPSNRPRDSAAPTLADKPSIAVLPFDNMSGDPEQEYFADGIAEDIITALSRFHLFYVIARNSSFTYKGEAVEVRQVARDLGVRYVIGGSVRRAGTRMRISIQLIDAINDHHIWSERYDRTVDDIFDVQDEITERIAMAVVPEISVSEMSHARSKAVTDLDTWETLARATWHHVKFTETDCATATDLLSELIELDPANARAHALMSGVYRTQGLYGWSRPAEDSHAMALASGQRGVELNKTDEVSLLNLGMALFFTKHRDEAVDRLRAAIKLNPNDASAISGLGAVLVFDDQTYEALELIEKAMLLSPKSPDMPWLIVNVASFHFLEGRYRDALEWTRKCLRETPNFPTALRLLAATHGQLGDRAAARAAYAEFEKIAPGSSIASSVANIPFKLQIHKERYAQGLRLAGMPET
jgi:adenylate cyclase